MEAKFDYSSIILGFTQTFCHLMKKKKKTLNFEFFSNYKICLQKLNFAPTVIETSHIFLHFQDRREKSRLIL